MSEYMKVTIELQMEEPVKVGDLASLPWTRTLLPMLPEGADVTGIRVQHGEIAGVVEKVLPPPG